MQRMSKQTYIRKDEFEDCIRSFCSIKETASNLRVSENTLRSWAKNTYGRPLSEVVDNLHSQGTYELRKIGLELAKRNATVWCFLAKNYLGLEDKPTPFGEEENTAVIELRHSIEIAAKSLKEIDVSSLASVPSCDEEE